MFGLKFCKFPFEVWNILLQKSGSERFKSINRVNNVCGSETASINDIYLSALFLGQIWLTALCALKDFIN